MATIDMRRVETRSFPAIDSPFHAAATLFNRSIRAISEFSTLYRQRQALCRVGDMDGRMLEDIGITRAEIDWTLRVNTAVELTALAQARRMDQYRRWR